jgi:hypothetical protein
MNHRRCGLRIASSAAACLTLTLLLTGGCGGRAHLTDSYGRATRAAFTGQAANPNAGSTPHKLPGLDAQEASIVVGNYHRALTAKGTQTDDDRGMLIVAPPDKTAGQPYMPPPSVPQERR